MRQDNDFIKSLIQKAKTDQNAVVYDVFIAGSGPIASTYARTILDKNKDAKIYIAEVGSQDSAVPGAHLQNSIRFQKDSGSFAQIIKASLQPVSVPPNDTYQPTLARAAWSPSLEKPLVIEGNNPKQVPQMKPTGAPRNKNGGSKGNQRGRACPKGGSLMPPTNERRIFLETPPKKKSTQKRKNTPKKENSQNFKKKQKRYKNHTQKNERDTRQKNTLKRAHERAHQKKKKLHTKKNLREDPNNNQQKKPPPAEQRTNNNPRVTTTTGDVILGPHVDSDHITLDTQSQLLGLNDIYWDKKRYIQCALLRKLNHSSSSSKAYEIIQAKTFIVACGAIGTPQILANSGYSFDLPLGKYLSEQSIAFCQASVVLRRNIVDTMAKDPATAEHQKNYPEDPLPIPFNDPDPQLILPYSSKYPWHVQINQYGTLKTQADPRIVLDLRYFGKSDVKTENRVHFSTECTDAYDMPQATFEVSRTDNDGERDQRMIKDMTELANVLGGYLPTSPPQFLEPGAALHITGTTRIGKDKSTSVANGESKVHGFENLWIGGNGCIPDAMASNPTLTSAAIAIKGASSVISYLSKYV
ncbi:GMC oxidoreductase [Sphaerobolus stellatus SS14]|uniref:GMC oxidoreductase n=1 Tax=Sphaerobolus stellatus (strain SS14) TaxID=990650 RepID=A0A0C9VCR1_SPHS4|nr:GMC oxidoreductase [Sphaerobolus stellatus SS14]